MKELKTALRTGSFGQTIKSIDVITRVHKGHCARNLGLYFVTVMCRIDQKYFLSL